MCLRLNQLTKALERLDGFYYNIRIGPTACKTFLFLFRTKRTAARRDVKNQLMLHRFVQPGNYGRGNISHGLLSVL